MPELSNSCSTCLRSLLGSMAWMISPLVGLLPRSAALPMKGAQASAGARSHAFLMALMKALNCLGTFGVLSTSTIGMLAFIACSILRFMRGSLPPRKMWPTGARASGAKGTASWSSLAGVA